VSVTASAAYGTAWVGTSHTVTVTYTLGGTDAGNYTAPGSQTFETGEITSRTLTVSGLAAVSRAYDGTTVAALTGTPTVSGMVGADDVTVAGTATGRFSDKNEGVAKPVAVAGLSLVGAAAGNYSLGTITLVADVTRAPLRIVAEDKRKVYDGAVFEGFTVRFEGFLGADTVEVVSGAASFGGPAVTAVAVGRYAIVVAAEGMTAANYSLETVDGTLVIDLGEPMFTAVIGGSGVGLPTVSESTGRFTLGATVGQTLAGEIAGEPGWRIFAGFWYAAEMSAASLQGLATVNGGEPAEGAGRMEEPGYRRLDFGPLAGVRMAMPAIDGLAGLEPAGVGVDPERPYMRAIGKQPDGHLRMEVAGLAGTVWLIQVRTDLVAGEWRTVGWIQLGRAGTGWVDVAPMEDEPARLFRLVHATR